MLENDDDYYIWQNSIKCTTFTIEIFLLVRMQFNYLYTIVPEGILRLKELILLRSNSRHQHSQSLVYSTCELTLQRQTRQQT